MCLISIIIPTLNSSKTIKQCLDSILNQTYKDFEVLIIDGISTDDTIKVCRSYNDNRINIHSIREEGIYEAMNKGITLSKAEWLYFIGSDDVLFDELTLKKVSNKLKVTKTLVVYGSVQILGDAGWATDHAIYDQKFNLRKILEKNICHQAIFYKKELLKKYYFKTKYKICADYDLNLMLFAKYRFEYIDFIIAKFTGGGRSKLKIDLCFDKNQLIIRYFFKFLHKTEFYPLKNSIRYRAIETKSALEKLYLNAAYIKHKYFANLN